MKIIICEDNKKYAEHIQNSISKYAFIEDNSIQVVLNTPSPKAVLKFIEQEEVECFFLDIDLGENEMSGFELAKEIRQNHPYAMINFVTTHNEMMQLAFKYQVEALDFIIKDDDIGEAFRNDILRALSTAYNKYISVGKKEFGNLKFFQVGIGDYFKNIKIDDILYFKAAETAHKIILVTKNGEFEFFSSLNKVETNEDFYFRCHRSYVVNLNNLSEVNWNTKTIIMNNGDECPISFRKTKALREKIAELGQMIS